MPNRPVRHVEAAFERSVRVSYDGQTTLLTPEALGAGPSIDDAVTAALAATPSSRIALPAHASQSKIASARRASSPIDTTARPSMPP